MQSNLHVFVPVEGGRKVKFLMSRHMNLALGVLSMLFQYSCCELAGVIDEITPAVILMQFESFFCGRWLTTTLEYVMMQSLGI